MKTYSTRETAKKLGLHPTTLADHVASGKLPSPTVLKVGTASLHAWTEEQIERARKLLPKIANGRKTRHKKKQSTLSSQYSAKRGTQPRAAALHKTALHKTKETKKSKKH